MAACFERTFYSNRTTRQSFYLYDSDGTGVALASTDVVRFKIGRGVDATPDLDLVNSEESTNGSGIDIISRAAPAQVAVVVSQDETITPGVYDAELLVIDDSVASPLADPTLLVNLGIAHIVGTQGGNVGKP